jgi:hypothetical protein
MGSEGSVRRREIERLQALYSPGSFTCTVLQGSEATFGQVMEELRADRMDELPDLVHYTGEIVQAGSELCLRLRDMPLSLGALRSVLSHGRLPFLVMNSPSSAYGLDIHRHQQRQSLRLPMPEPMLFESREGFMDLAVQQGVGAFVGAFDHPEASAGADFMVTLHRALAAGHPIAEAVLQARVEVRKKLPVDPTPLQYVLSGDGGLQLVRPEPK